MHLKRIEIHGFKSFADRTVIDFPAGVTAIVGPNGSGKSNIVDAVRWVLGEQSAKALRGGTMEDVIFAGTASRPPLGYAEVTLVFDNRSGLFPVPHAEVALGRRLYRSGESEYFLNKTPCRLKDIQELLMDSGIGKRAHVIIEQGKIEEIITAKPEARRQIFEEAAGIAKYRHRRQEAARKLELVEANLVRLRDRMEELERQEANLKRQAAKAERYREAEAELRGLEVRTARIRLRDLEVRRARLAEEIRSARAEWESARAAVEEAAVRLREAEAEEAERARAQEAASEDARRAAKALADAEAEVRLVSERAKALEAEFHRTVARRDEAREAAGGLAAERRAAEENAERAAREAEAAQAEAKERAAAAEAAEAEAAARREAAEAKEAAFREARRAADEAREAIARAEREAAGAEEAIRRLEADLLEADSAVRASDDAFAAAAREADEAEERARTARADRDVALDAARRYEAEADSAEEILRAAERRSEVLRGLRKARRASREAGEIFEGCFESAPALGAWFFLPKGERIGPRDVVYSVARLASDAEDLEGVVAEADAALAAAREAFLAARASAEAARSAAREAEGAYGRAASEAEGARRAREEAASRRVSAEAVREKVRKELAARRAAFEAAQARLVEADGAQAGEEIARLEKERDAAVAACREAERQAAQIRREADGAAGRAEVAAHRKDDASREAARIAASIADAERRAARDAERIVEIEADLEELVQRAEAAERTRARCADEAAAAERCLAEAGEALAAARRLRNEAAQAAETERCRLDAARERMHEAERETATVEAERAELVKNYRERFETDLVPAPPEERIEEGAEEKIRALRERIRRLGAVNFEAAEEIGEISTRLAALRGEAEDVEAAAADLRQVIDRMDGETEKVFLETFQAIASNFAVLFRRLFEGGEAEVVILDPKRPLESGVEIVARPPGKKPQSISLLSGGEKAMTAIALLFAVFLVRPSPFSILDELDAPLDEANIGRYTRLLREFSKKTQFVIVTHNRATMETAETLYGVTMAEKGVSKVLSVRLEEAQRNAELNTAMERAG